MSTAPHISADPLQPLIQQQAAEVDAAEANVKFAQGERNRYDDLMKTGSGTLQRAQQTDATLRSQTAQLQQSKAGLIASNKKVEVLSTQRAQTVAQRDHARAVEQQAALNIFDGPQPLGVVVFLLKKYARDVFAIGQPATTSSIARQCFGFKPVLQSFEQPEGLLRTGISKPRSDYFLSFRIYKIA